MYKVLIVSGRIIPLKIICQPLITHRPTIDKKRTQYINQKPLHSFF